MSPLLSPLLSPLRHLTFANLTGGTALALVLLGGGYAVADGALAHNSVGSAQIRKNGVHSSDVKNSGLTGADIKDGSLTGADVNASSLGKVPSAAAVDGLSSSHVTAAAGQTVTVATRGSLVVELVCLDGGGGNLEGELTIRTTVDHAAYSADLGALGQGDLLVSDGPQALIDVINSAPDLGEGSFVAMSATGAAWQGHGQVMVHPGGAARCVAEMTFTD